MGFTGILLEARLSDPVWQPSNNIEVFVAEVVIAKVVFS